MNNLDIVLEAIEFASTAHAGVLRGGRGAPYLNHVIDVSRRVHRHGFVDPLTLAASILHDVVEDTPIKLQVIEDRFGLRVAELVGHLTLPEDVRKDRDKKHAYQVGKMKVMDLDGQAIKIADKTSNVFDLYADPPKWGLRAIRGYSEAAREVVLLARKTEDESNRNDPRIEALIGDFESTFLIVAKHYGWSNFSATAG